MQSYILLGLGAVIGGLVYLRKIKAGGVCKYSPDLSGKVVIITGCNTGIGLETAKTVAKLNATVILANRPSAKSEEALQIVKDHAKHDRVYGLPLDLSDVDSVRAFSKKFAALNMKCNILINNAGVMMCPYLKTAQGLELQVGTNHVGHFILTNDLLPLMDHENGRIVNLSSMAHLFSQRLTKDVFFRAEKDYDSSVAYNNSKLANVYFAAELQRRLKEQGSKIKTVSVHPGAVATDLGRHFKIFYLIEPVIKLFFKTPLEGAQTSLFAAFAPEIETMGGKYLKDCALASSTAIGEDPEAAKQWWTWTEEVIQEIDAQSSKKTK